MSFLWEVKRFQKSFHICQMVNPNSIPKEFYDIESLFPKEIGACHPKFDKFDQSLLPSETKRWLSKSAFTCGTVGLLSKFWLTCKFFRKLKRIFFIKNTVPLNVQPDASVICFIYFLWFGAVNFLTQMKMWSLFYTDPFWKKNLSHRSRKQNGIVIQLLLC